MLGGVEERIREEGKIGDGQNVMGDVISGCRDAPRGKCGECIEGNMERLTGRREHMQTEEETNIHSEQKKGEQWQRKI